MSAVFSQQSPSGTAGADPTPADRHVPRDPRPIVFWGSGSPPAWRVCSVLLEKGVDFLSHRVHFDTGFLRTPEFLALNPRGLVPTLVDGDLVMYESLAILMYLEDKYPHCPLLPKELTSRAKVYMRMQEANNASSAAGEIVYYVRRTAPEKIHFPYLRSKFDVLAEELKLWESYLEGSDYLGGADMDVTLADFSFFPNLAYMVRLGLELEPKYPNLAAYFRRMCSRKSILASWPPHWRETQGHCCLSASLLPPEESTVDDVHSSLSGAVVPRTFDRVNVADTYAMSAESMLASSSSSTAQSSSSSSSSSSSMDSTSV